MFRFNRLREIRLIVTFGANQGKQDESEQNLLCEALLLTFTQSSQSAAQFFTSRIQRNNQESFYLRKDSNGEDKDQNTQANKGNQMEQTQSKKQGEKKF